MDIEIIPKEWFLENPKGRLMEKFARNNISDFYNYIQQFPGEKFAEKLYNYYEGNNDIPICECGRKLKFKSFSTGYHNYCSQKCNIKSPKRTEKIKNTLFKKYGVDNASKSEEIKKKKEQSYLKHYGTKHYNNRDKASNTMTKRYGVNNISKLDDIKNKKKNTLLEHYNGDLTSIKEKTKQTCLKKYGVDSVFKLPEVREKSYQNYYKKFLNENPIVLSVTKTQDDISYKCKCPHENCNKCNEKIFDITAHNYNSRVYANVELCTKLLPFQSDKIKNTTIEIFIKNILDEYNIKYETNVRNIISPKEIDIFIPDKNLAIECNGCYWHSCKNKPQQYHLNKFKLCEELGIQLISVWEDFVMTCPNKVRSLILSKLGIYETRIGARKCVVKEISSTDSESFLNKYHLQNNSNASVKVGLYYEDELISVMTFGKRKLFKNDGWEMVRYCVKNGYQIVGGADKMMKYFIQNYNPSNIISFSSNDISNGNLYKKLGFEKEKITQSYWYIDSKFKRYHRYNFRKSELIQKGYDASKSEFEITDEIGLMRIYDSGMTKWIKYL